MSCRIERGADGAKGARDSPKNKLCGVSGARLVKGVKPAKVQVLSKRQAGFAEWLQLYRNVAAERLQIDIFARKDADLQAFLRGVTRPALSM
jgi:hypothetical protein